MEMYLSQLYKLRNTTLARNLYNLLSAVVTAAPPLEEVNIYTGVIFTIACLC